MSTLFTVEDISKSRTGLLEVRVVFGGIFLHKLLDESGTTNPSAQHALGFRILHIYSVRNFLPSTILAVGSCLIGLGE